MKKCRYKQKKQALKSGAPGDSRWADTVSFFFLVSPLCVAKKLKYAAKKVAQSLGPRWEAARNERPTEPFCTETFPLGFIFLHPGALWFSHQKRHLWPNCGFDERPSSVCCRPRNKTVGCASSPHRTAADLPPISHYWWKCPRSWAKKRALPMVKELCSVIQPRGSGGLCMCTGNTENWNDLGLCALFFAFQFGLTSVQQQQRFRHLRDLTICG